MSKQKAFAAFGFLALLVLALNVVSATLVVSNTSSLPSTIYSPSTINIPLSFNYSGADNITVDLSLSSPISSWGVNQTIFVSNDTLNTTSFTINVPSNQTISSIQFKIYANGTSTNNDDLSWYASIVQNISSPVNNTTTVTDQQIINSLCGGWAYSSSEMDISSVDNKEIDNEDSWKWRPLDKTEIEFDLENNAADEEDHDYDIELFFYSNGEDKTSNIVDDEDTLLEENFDVDEGRDETLNFAFEIDGSTDKYSSLDVWVVVKELDNEKCYAEKIKSGAKIDKVNDPMVIVKSVESSKTVKAGETITLEVEVANIGDQDEEMVKVLAYNNALGINTYRELESLDEGDTATVTFTIAVPETANEGTYKLLFSTEFDYDDGDEEYGEESDSDDDYTHTISVFGGIASQPTIGAKLLSDAKVGKELSIELSLTNNGKSNATYMVELENTDWAKDVSLDASSLIVKPGETKTIEVKLTPKSAGTKDFTVKTVYNDGEIKKQSIAVSISGNVFASMVATLGVVGTTLVSAIVVLMIIILVVAIVKLAKPKRQQQRIESIAY